MSRNDDSASGESTGRKSDGWDEADVSAAGNDVPVGVHTQHNVHIGLIRRTAIYETRSNGDLGGHEVSPYPKCAALLARLFHDLGILVLGSPAIFLLIVAICLLSRGALARPGMLDKESLPDYSYTEDFETHDPFLPWTSDGSYVVNYKGLTYERSISGHRSFKLDITLGTAKYVYFRIPVDIPVADNLSFKADVYLSKDDSVAVAIGPQILYRPSPFEGYLNDKSIHQTGRWVPVSFNLVTEAERALEQCCELKLNTRYKFPRLNQSNLCGAQR